MLTRGAWIGEYDAALARKEPFYPHARFGVVLSPHVRGRAAYSPPFALLTAAAQNTARKRYVEGGRLCVFVRVCVRVRVCVCAVLSPRLPIARSAT